MKQNNFKLVRIFVLLLLFIPSLAMSNSPKSFSVQGKAFDNNGKPFADGIYSIKASLYDNFEAAEPIWFTKQDINVPVKKGIFSIKLIEELIENPFPEFDKGNLWLSIEFVNEKIKLSKLELTPSIYSFYSEKSGMAKSLDEEYINGIMNELEMKLPPIGTITAFAGKTEMVPKNWLICKGQALKSWEYPKLHEIIGTIWGDGSDDNDNETDFNLPDLRGMFLRGVDDGAGVDPDADYRTAPKSGANSGDKIGSAQGDADSNNSSDLNNAGNFSASLERVSSGNRLNIRRSESGEFRPKNANVYYIIRAE